MRIQAAVTTERGAGFVLHDVDLDEPRPDEVRVAVRSVGVCHTDLMYASAHPRASMPAVLGHEGAGVIEAVGSDVRGYDVGDRVLTSYDSCGVCARCRAGRPYQCEIYVALNFAQQRADGSTAYSLPDGTPVHSHFFGQSTFATHANVRARTLVRLPDDVPFEIASPLACGVQTGSGAVLNVMRARPQSRVAVIGLGGVGLGAVMAARIAGVQEIVAIDPVPTRRDLARELGAHVSLDPRSETFADDLRDVGGIDHILDTSGRPETVDPCFLALVPGGQLLVVSSPSTRSWTFPSGALIEGRKVQGVTLGEAVPQNFVPFLLECWRDGRFPVERIVTTFPFADVERAIAAMHAHEVVKPVLVTG